MPGLSLSGKVAGAARPQRVAGGFFPGGCAAFLASQQTSALASFASASVLRMQDARLSPPRVLPSKGRDGRGRQTKGETP